MKQVLSSLVLESRKHSPFLGHLRLQQGPDLSIKSSSVQSVGPIEPVHKAVQSQYSPDDTSSVHLYFIQSILALEE